jgi:hypothetical protein
MRFVFSGASLPIQRTLTHRSLLLISWSLLLLYKSISRSLLTLLRTPSTPPEDANMLRDGGGAVSGGALTVVSGLKAGQMVAVGGGGGGVQCRLAFRVTVATNFGEEVFLCGSSEALGEWVPQKVN